MFSLNDFKGFANAQIDLFAPLTLLIGPNGSGKTNAIEGIQLLAAVAEGVPLHEITNLGRGGTLEIRGGLPGCPRYGCAAFSLGLDATIGHPFRSGKFAYRVDIESHPQARIIHESLTVSSSTHRREILFETTGLESGGATVRVRYNNFARGGAKPTATVTAQRSVLSQYEEFAGKIRRFPDALRFIQTIREHLRRSFAFDPDPHQMRGYERIGNTVLLRNGANLSAVLYHLHQTDPATLARLLDTIREFPDRPYEGFDFITTRLSDVQFGLQEGGQLTHAGMLSDGTLRALAVLTALETAPHSSGVIVEEFDNGLHPSRVHTLLEAAQKTSQRRRLRVLFTTHNPATLNGLTPAQLRHVVLAARRTPTADCELIPLPELPRYEELMAQGRLGDLVTEKAIERYLQPDFAAKRQQRIAEFVSSLPK